MRLLSVAFCAHMGEETFRASWQRRRNHKIPWRMKYVLKHDISATGCQIVVGDDEALAHSPKLTTETPRKSVRDAKDAVQRPFFWSNPA